MAGINLYNKHNAFPTGSGSDAGLRILTLQAQASLELNQHHFCKQKILVGRFDQAGRGDHPDLEFNHDPCVSRKHVRLRKSGTKWFIEDLGSKRGTLLDGREIKGAGEIELLPGTLVKTGQTLWTFFPDDWLFIRQQEVIVYGPCTAVNYAAYHCGLPIVGPLKARNVGERTSSSFSFCLEVAGYSDVCQIEVPPVKAGESFSLPRIPLRLHVELLRSVVEPISARLIARLEGSDQHLEKDVRVLGFWDWPYDGTARKTLAAFVLPRNPIVARIAQEASRYLNKEGFAISFDVLRRSAQKDAKRMCFSALYRFLKECGQIRYVGPRLDHLPGSGKSFQRVRAPQHIFLGTDGWSGEANCLDLALLMAGCMENVGLLPLVFLLGEDSGRVTHAFSGCWVGATPGPRAVIERDELLRHVISFCYRIHFVPDPPRMRKCEI